MSRSPIEPSGRATASAGAPRRPALGKARARAASAVAGFDAVLIAHVRPGPPARATEDGTPRLELGDATTALETRAAERGVDAPSSLEATREARATLDWAEAPVAPAATARDPETHARTRAPETDDRDPPAPEPEPAAAPRAPDPILEADGEPVLGARPAPEGAVDSRRASVVHVADEREVGPRGVPPALEGQVGSGRVPLDQGSAPSPQRFPTERLALAIEATPPAPTARDVRREAPAPIAPPRPPEVDLALPSNAELRSLRVERTRAELVVGDGPDRISMVVTADRGHVRVEAVVASDALAATLKRAQGDLEHALGQHGLLLDGFALGSERRDREEHETRGDESSEAPEHPSQEAPRTLATITRIIA
jgi:hypothetical protein